ncbi:MAG: hypothetical protein HQL15_01900 [Candidatus Omnitrophica bacterium]|nr:hypothetical protein [Candidatus Omnitrophota bacterium]
MRRILILSLLSLLAFTNQAKAIAFTDPAVLAAILQQTVTQTAEHLSQLAQAIQTVQTLQQQLSSTQGILQLAQANAQGIEGLQTVGDFRNVVLATNNLIRNVQSTINTSQDISSQWKNLFGSLDPWVANSTQTFSNIDFSDKTNSAGYLVADSYQNLYDQNSKSVQQFTDNANNVSEKGALKQIAVEIAQLIQMENNMTYLLAQVLKTQSIESSNENLKRKQEAIEFEQENQGVKDFMGVVTSQTFKI